MTISEKVAYLKGMMEGMEFDESSKEGKLIKMIADVLEDMGMSVEDLEDETAALNEYVEEIDEDLSVLEDEFYGIDDDCDCDDCDCDDEDEEDDDCDCACGCHGGGDEENGYTDFFELTCPSCGEQVYLDDTLDPSRVICPSCHEVFSAKTEN